ncbi:putative diguanylate cyclase [Escherichia coli]|uniref:Putative diguanylate cyclase n=1 Tax=Escherichia coli TaxID=562 RepID=A0A2X1M3D6_ECOLX|nr:putative diguanylate cyclase [Escherichia coli]
MVLPGGILMEIRKTLQPLLGQLSWLAEQSCAHHHVLALDSREEMVSGQTH